MMIGSIQIKFQRNASGLSCKIHILGWRYHQKQAFTFYIDTA